ncbi:hypothetical protein DFH11DRAFT_1543309 [Phellopilus nigrolimitatus]|nr:hypothetical protein DFH11DRAFT_1543309 [Phellopilus nigrolimitatus]
MLQNEGHAAETHAALLAEAKASRKDVPHEARRGTHALQQLGGEGRSRGRAKGAAHGARAEPVLEDAAHRQEDTSCKKQNPTIFSRHGQFFVTKLIHGCPAHCVAILLESRGAVVRLLLHRGARRRVQAARERERASSVTSTGVSPRVGTTDEREKAQLKKGLVNMLEGGDSESFWAFAEFQQCERILAAVKENVQLV